MSEPETLDELARRRRDDDRPTHVHVVGDFSQDPPEGTATAKRVAYLLAGSDGEVLDEDYDDLEDGDVAFVRIDDPPVESYEVRQDLRQLAALSRARRLGGIVVFTERVHARIEEHLDARVRADSGDVDRVERLQVDPYDGYEVYTTELGGLVEA